MSGGVRRAEERSGWLLAAPFVVGTALFVVWPVWLALRTSFTEYALIEEPLAIGLENYRELASDRTFLRSLRNTGLYALLAVPLNIAVALGIALLLEQRLRGRGVVRAVVFLPVLVPIVAASLGWMWLYHPDHGLWNRGLRALGLDGLDWLGDARFALVSLVLMGAWIVGTQVLVFAASLRGVRRDLLDAARLDGAGPLWRFRAVTLHAIGPALLFNAVVSTIWATQVFATPLVMTGGGPGEATKVIAMVVWENAFRYGRMGYASAAAWLQFVATLALALFVVVLGRRWIAAELEA